MKPKLHAITLAIICTIALAGCYTTPTGSLRVGSPARSSVVGLYERPFSQVCSAAITVIKLNGVLTKDTQLPSETNLVRVVEGRVEQNRVVIRIDSVEPNLSQVTVQARTQMGGANLDLAHEIEKQIALQLATMPPR